MKKYDYIIVGAGASGLYLGQFLNNCLIIEKDTPGKKILMSGGGNCNFTNKNITAFNYHSQNPDFAKFALDNFKQEDFFALLKANKLSWQEKTHGRLFLRQGSKALLDVFIKNLKAKIKSNYEITSIEKKDDLYTINNEFSTPKLIIATGGMSAGGTDFGIKVAKQFKLKIVHTYPALVRLDLEDDKLLSLAGLSIQDVKSKHFKDGVVFTKRGIGGPLIYQLSLYNPNNEEITLDFSECEHIPKRLRAILTKDKKLSIKPKKTAGFKFAEAMAGGVDTAEICPKSFESYKSKGLYFIGEVLDITGNLGGYNLHWAWASAYSLWKSISKNSKI